MQRHAPATFCVLRFEPGFYGRFSCQLPGTPQRGVGAPCLEAHQRLCQAPLRRRPPTPSRRLRQQNPPPPCAAVPAGGEVDGNTRRSGGALAVQGLGRLASAIVVSPTQRKPHPQLLLGDERSLPGRASQTAQQRRRPLPLPWPRSLPQHSASPSLPRLTRCTAPLRSTPPE